MNFISFVQKLNSNPAFREPATISIKVNSSCKESLISQSKVLDAKIVKLPIGQLIHADAEYVKKTNFANLNTKDADVQMWKQKYEQERGEKLEANDRAMYWRNECIKLRKVIEIAPQNSNIV